MSGVILNVTELNRPHTIGDGSKSNVINRFACGQNGQTTPAATAKRRASLCGNNGAIRSDDRGGGDDHGGGGGGGGNENYINDCDNSSATYSDSDSDFEDIVPLPALHNNNLNRSSTSSIMLMDSNLDTAMPRQSSIICANANSDVKPNIGSIAVQNSSDITFGNKTFYQGPVTIKQFVYDKNNKWKETESIPNDNLGSPDVNTDKLSEMGKRALQQMNCMVFSLSFSTSVLCTMPSVGVNSMVSSNS